MEKLHGKDKSGNTIVIDAIDGKVTFDQIGSYIVGCYNNSNQRVTNTIYPI